MPRPPAPIAPSPPPTAQGLARPWASTPGHDTPRPCRSEPHQGPRHGTPRSREQASAPWQCTATARETRGRDGPTKPCHGHPRAARATHLRQDSRWTGHLKPGPQTTMPQGLEAGSRNPRVGRVGRGPHPAPSHTPLPHAKRRAPVPRGDRGSRGSNELSSPVSATGGPVRSAPGADSSHPGSRRGCAARTSWRSPACWQPASNGPPS